MKHLIKKKDGSVAIMTTVSDDINPINEIAKWEIEEREKVDSIVMIEESDIPVDRYFREAWTESNQKINVDIEKCREIHRNKLRELRAPKLQELDLEFMKAVEAGNTEKQREVAVLKQALRDIPQSPEILNATTPEEIKAFMPSILE